ncbi:MAG: radical SAM protein [Deltaproteobacteria bacterium]|nr:radical SAM protein [Deltaproteobacteria bacterium]
MREVEFEVEALLAALAPTLRRGRLLTGGWKLVDALFVRDDTISLRLVSRRGGALELWVSPRDEGREAYARTPHFNVNYRRPRQRGADPGAEGAGAGGVLRLVVRALERADAGQRRWIFPEVPPAPPEVAVAVYTLSLPSPCGLRCTFCGIEPEPALAARTLAELHSELHQGREQGARLLNLTGTEPLAHPHALGLVREAVRLGYEELHISTAGLPLADRAFAEALADALPGRYELSIPILAAEAELHDALTRTPGSHQRLLEALAIAREVFEPSRIKLVCVVLAQNLAAIPDLARHAAALGLELQLQLPFPDRAEPGSRYEAVALRYEEAVEALLVPGSELSLSEVHPCILWRHEQATGLPVFTRLGGERSRLTGRAEVDSQALAARGTRLRAGVPSVACPEREACALAGQCSGAIYRAYAERFGLGEFRAVPAEALAPSGT